MDVCMNFVCSNISPNIMPPSLKNGPTLTSNGYEGIKTETSLLLTSTIISKVIAIIFLRKNLILKQYELYYSEFYFATKTCYR